jgi:DNA-binding transcriptional MerR regulator
MDGDKNIYTSDEICSLLGIKSYVLRFWEKEFAHISPELGPDGERFYGKNDLETISEIKKLLFEQKYTVKKTKDKLKRVLIKEVANKRPPIVGPKVIPEREKILVLKKKFQVVVDQIQEIRQPFN